MADTLRNAAGQTPLAERARRAFEVGRIGQSAWIGSWVALLGALALVGCTHRNATALVALAVAGFVVFAEWRGLDW